MIKQKTRNEINDDFKWDLSKMYKSTEWVLKDVEKVQELRDNLLKFEGHVLESSNTLEESINIYMSINRILENLYIYTNLKLDEDTSVNKSIELKSKIEDLYIEISSDLSFYTTEILHNDYSLVKKYIDEQENLKIYDFYFRDLFKSKKHVLSLKEEKLLAKVSDVLSSASDIYDVINDTDMSFGTIIDKDKKEVELTSSNYERFIESKDRNIRKEAFKTLHKSYYDLRNTLSLCLAKNIKADNLVSSIRGYNSVLEASLYLEDIDLKLYDKLIEKVSNRLDILHEYLKIRKKILGVDFLHAYDLNNPLIEEVDNNYSYEDAKKIVIDALRPLGDEYINDLKKAFDEKWVDVYSNKSKKSGAYSWGTYDSNPYILLNYENRLDDASTLAHELGHSMHSYYSNKNQEYVNANYSVFLAEVASQVNEILLNKHLYNKTNKKQEKLYLLNSLLDIFRGALIHQTMFAEFEKKLYDMDQNEEALTYENMSHVYYDLYQKYYKGMTLDEEIRVNFLRIPHFFRGFYVYQYATGIAISCYIANEILNGNNKVKDGYLQLLKSGGKDYPLNILKECGIDIVNGDIIDCALDMFSDTLKEFIENLE